MKIELVKRLKELIEAYQATSELTVQEIRKTIDEWKDQVNVYRPEYISEQIKSGIDAALTNSKNVSTVYNQKLKAIIAEVKEQVLPVNNFQRPADYATQVNNALQFLQIEGESITDDSAYMILKDFIDDIDQMKLFKNVIGKRVELEDYNGNSTFPKTFGKLNQVEVLHNTFNEIEAIANMLFLYPKQDGQTYVVNGEQYTLPLESYEQMANEDDILNLAAVIEEMAASIPGVESVTDQTEHNRIDNDETGETGTGEE